MRGNDTVGSEYYLQLSDVRLIEHNRDNQFPLDAVKLGGLVGESIFATSEGQFHYNNCCCVWQDRVGSTSCDASQPEGDQVRGGRVIQTNCTDITRNCISSSSHPLRRPSSGRMEAVVADQSLFRRLRRGGSGGIERAGRAAALLVAELTRRGATLGAQTDSCPSGDDQHSASRGGRLVGAAWARIGREPVLLPSDRSGRTSGPGGNERPVRLVC